MLFDVMKWFDSQFTKWNTIDVLPSSRQNDTAKQALFFVTKATFKWKKSKDKLNI